MKVRGTETKVWNGTGVDPATLENWAEQILKKFEKDPVTEIHYFLSGDSLVMGTNYGRSPQIYFTQLLEITDLPRNILNFVSTGASTSTSAKADGGIYCSCGGPTTIVPIFGDMVKVCKTCKKEVK